MKAARIAVALFVLVLLGLTGVMAYLPAYLETHRQLIEGYASEALGRRVRIAGGVTWAWSLPPSIVLAGVRVENPQWPMDPRLARAATVEVQIALSGLLTGKLELKGLVVRQAEIRLEAGAEGQSNWTFPPTGRGEVSLPVTSVLVLDSSLVVRAGDGTVRQLSVKRLALRRVGRLQAALEIEGAYVGVPVSIVADAGQGDGHQTKRWPFRLRARAAGAELEVAGSAAAPFDGAGIEADTRLKGEDLRSLGQLVSQNHLPQGPFEIAFHLSREGGEYWVSKVVGSLAAPPPLGRIAVSTGEARISRAAAISAVLEGNWRGNAAAVKVGLAGVDSHAPAAARKLDVVGAVGDIELTGELQLARHGPRPSIAGDVSFRGGAVRGADVRAPPAGARQDRGHWSDLALPLTVLKAFDADLRLTAKLVREDLLRVELRAGVAIAHGVLRLDGLGLILNGVSMQGQGRLDARREPATLDLTLTAGRVQLPQALLVLSNPPKIAGSLQGVSLGVRATGDTPRALIGSLDGELTARKVSLRTPGGPDRAPTEIRLTRARLVVTPGQPVRLRAGVAAQDQTFALDVTGGPPANLLSEEKPWPTIKLVARGLPPREDVEIRGVIGPLSAFFTGGALQVDLSGRARGAMVRAKGRIARFDRLEGVRIALRASARSGSAFGRLLGFDLPQGWPVDATARLEGGQRRFVVRDLKAASGDSDIEGELRVELGKRIRVTAAIASRLLDLTPYLSLSVASASEG